MRYRLIAFDWDGTLVDSVDHIVSSIKYAAEKLAFDSLDNNSVKNIIGLGMNEAIKTLYSSVTDADIVRFKRFYSEAFFSEVIGKNHLFPNAEEVLRHFQSQDVILAVATGKGRNGLDKALDSTGLKSYFSIERCADESASKPNPLMLEQIMSVMNIKPSEMLMVGDTDFDMDMAERAGVDRVGVSYGAQACHRLESFNPLCIVDDLSELLTLA